MSGLCQSGYPHRPGWENLCIRSESKPRYLPSIRDEQSPQRSRNDLQGICWKLARENTSKETILKDHSWNPSGSGMTKPVVTRLQIPNTKSQIPACR